MYRILYPLSAFTLGYFTKGLCIRVSFSIYFAHLEVLLDVMCSSLEAALVL
jgi:hypothetical protein